MRQHKSEGRWGCSPNDLRLKTQTPREILMNMEKNTSEIKGAASVAKLFEEGGAT